MLFTYLKLSVLDRNAFLIANNQQYWRYFFGANPALVLQSYGEYNDVNSSL